MKESAPKTWVVSKAIVVNPEAKILALRRSKTAPAQPLTWDLPGGIIEYGEDPTAGIIREASEETGQVIGGLRSLSVTSAYSERGYAILLVFLATAPDSIVELSYEHDQ